MMFKIAQMVLLNDNRRARVMAELAPRRYRVCVFGTGELLDLPAGDLALPGEDRDIAARELSAERWATGPRGPGYISDGLGNTATTPADPEIGYDS